METCSLLLKMRRESWKLRLREQDDYSQDATNEVIDASSKVKLPQWRSTAQVSISIPPTQHFTLCPSKPPAKPATIPSPIFELIAYLRLAGVETGDNTLPHTLRQAAGRPTPKPQS